MVTEFFNNLIHLFKCSYLLITTSGASCLARRKITKFSPTPLHQNNIILSCVICLFIHINIRERERERGNISRKKKKMLFGWNWNFFFFFNESFNLWRPLLMIVLYYQIKTPINFWCRWELIQPSEILPVKLTGQLEPIPVELTAKIKCW